MEQLTRPRGEDETQASTLRRLSQYSAIGLFALALIFSLHNAAGLVAPIVAAIVVGTVLAQLGDRVQRLGLPPMLAAAALATAVGAGLFLVVDALSARVSGLAGNLPELVDRLSRTFAPLLERFHALKTQWLGGAGGASQDFSLPSFDMGWISGFLSGVTPALGGVAIFLATLFFYVAGRADLRRALVMASGLRERRLSILRIVNATETALAHYFGSAALIYACLGLLTAVAAWACGLGTPALWGVLTFIASFVPFLGAAVVFVSLLAGGVASDSVFVVAFLPAAIFLGAHLIFENAILPAVIGRRFEINPFVVFVSIVFWTWMWGAVGAVLASPLLIILQTVMMELREPTSPSLPK